MFLLLVVLFMREGPGAGAGAGGGLEERRGCFWVCCGDVVGWMVPCWIRALRSARVRSSSLMGWWLRSVREMLSGSCLSGLAFSAASRKAAKEVVVVLRFRRSFRSSRRLVELAPGVTELPYGPEFASASSLGDSMSGHCASGAEELRVSTRFC